MFDPIFEGFAWLLAALYSLVPNYGFAIAGLTLVVYLAMAPVTLKQTRSGLEMSRLQPELTRLKKEHKGDPKALMAAQQELYAREGVNPAASCLPMLLQMPIFIILWQILAGLTRRTTEGVPHPKYLERSSRLYQDIVADGGELVSFGVDLAKTAVQGPHASFGAALPYYLLAVAAAGATYLQLKRSQGRNPSASEIPPAMAMMTKIMPVMTLMSGLFFPAGLGLYILTSSLFRSAQQEAMYRWDPHVVRHSQAAAVARADAGVTDTTAKPVPKRKAEPEPKNKSSRGGEKASTNGSDPSPARDSGRAQPKGTQGKRRKRKKSRR